MFLTFVLLLIGSIFIGCTAQSTSTDVSDIEEGGKLSDSQKTYKWVAQSPWPPGTGLQKLAEMIAQDITEASGGRLQIEMHAGGEIVSAFEILDAVDQGILDAAHNWDGYVVGKIPQASLFAFVPMGMNEQEYMGWITTDEGLDLWQEIYDYHQYNVKVLPGGAGTPEIFYHSNKPIKNLEDLKGLKVRAVADWAAIVERAGATVVTLDGSEVYQALERGVVDAIEFASPASNFPMGFHEIARYVVTPAIHQPGNPANFIVNKKKWEELPDDLKKIVTIATENMWGKGWAFLAEEDMNYMQKYRELEEKGQIEIIEFDPESQEELKKIINEYYEEQAQKDPLFKKIWESQQRYMNEFRYWKKLMTPQY